jgi:hypothetical protein
MITIIPNPTPRYMRNLHERMIVAQAIVEQKREELSDAEATRAALQAEIDYHQPPQSPAEQLAGMIAALRIPDGEVA